jgi:hypothetical protein
MKPSNDPKYRQLRRLLAPVVTILFASLNVAHACDKSADYRTGDILKITTMSRAETNMGGPQPPRQDDGPAPQAALANDNGPTYLRLRSDGHVYSRGIRAR